MIYDSSLAKNLCQLTKDYIATRSFVKTASIKKNQLYRKFLIDKEVPATLLLECLLAYLGAEVITWEPESIWYVLDKKGLDIPVENRDKIGAAIGLRVNPSFYWDNLVFQNTIAAFNNEISEPNVLQECHPSHIGWSLYEAELIRGTDPEDNVLPEFDYEPKTYAAACHLRAGFVQPIDLCEFCEETIDFIQPRTKRLRNKVKLAWKKLDKDNLEDHEFKEDEVDIQLAKLASSHLYIQKQIENYNRYLDEFRNV